MRQDKGLVLRRVDRISNCGNREAFKGMAELLPRVVANVEKVVQVVREVVIDEQVVSRHFNPLLSFAPGVNPPTGRRTLSARTRKSRSSRVFPLIGAPRFELGTSSPPD